VNQGTQGWQVFWPERYTEQVPEKFSEARDNFSHESVPRGPKQAVLCAIVEARSRVTHPGAREGHHATLFIETHRPPGHSWQTL
jgi:hypothetical protein